MGRSDIKYPHGRLLFGAAFCPALAFALLVATPAARGQNVAQPPSAGETLRGADALQEPIIIGSESLPPAVTVEHRGRLLVLTCGKSAGGVLSSNVSPRGQPPRFTVYRGQRQIASGQFEYG